MTRDELRAMQAEAKAAVPETAHQKATLTTIVLLCEVVERLEAIHEDLRAKGKV